MDESRVPIFDALAVHRETDRDHAAVRRVGIEEELLLVDAATFHPAARAGRILREAADGEGAPAGSLLQAEVKQEQIEVVSAPLLTFDELLGAVVSGRRAADIAARRHGARAVALATAPMGGETHVVSSPRYEWMAQRFGLTMIEQLTCGFHVHVSIASREEGVAILDRVRPWLPLLLALSANSPYWGGADSGFASYRYQAWGRWPGAGAYDRFGTAGAYDAAIAAMLGTGVMLDAGMVYFDARLSGHVPTVEFRIADVCLAPEAAAVLAVLVRALADAAAAQWRAGVGPDDVPTDVLRLACWQASRYGLDGDLIHPVRSTPRPAAECVDALLEHVADHFLTRAEGEQVRRGIAEMFWHGNGAAQQRQVRAAAGTLEAVVEMAASRTHRAGAPPR